MFPNLPGLFLAETNELMVVNESQRDVPWGVDEPMK
jgi:hypothetical protein